MRYNSHRKKREQKMQAIEQNFLVEEVTVKVSSLEGATEDQWMILEYLTDHLENLYPKARKIKVIGTTLFEDKVELIFNWHPQMCAYETANMYEDEEESIHKLLKDLRKVL